MVLAAFLTHGKFNLVQIKNRLNSSEYVKVLQNNLVPWIEGNLPVSWILQQDSVPVHAVKATLDWRHSNSVHFMKRPACSPDPDPVENLWGILTRAGYDNNRQFGSLKDLFECVLSCWESIFRRALVSTVESMYCCLVVVARDGRVIA